MCGMPVLPVGVSLWPSVDTATGHMSKCDLCYDYRDSGQNPACVDACPSRALGWGPIQELRDTHGSEAGIAPLPDPSITQPHLVILAHRDAQSWDAGSGHIAEPEGDLMNVHELPMILFTVIGQMSRLVRSGPWGHSTCMATIGI